MRQVVGKATKNLDASDFRSLRGDRPELLLDLGTGDGKHVLTEARRRPSALVVGLDAAPDAMRPTALTAARKPVRGGVPNAVFVWASAQSPPGELAGVTEVHSLMPWGSLLQALVAPEVEVLRAIAALCVPAASFLITINLHAWRPPVAEVGDVAEPSPESALTDLSIAYADAGWHLDAAHYPGAAELADLGTSWTKRLSSTRDDLAVLALRGTIG